MCKHISLVHTSIKEINDLHPSKGATLWNYVTYSEVILNVLKHITGKSSLYLQQSLHKFYM
jgi:hypothetical protein